MSVRTKEHLTKGMCTLRFVGPTDQAQAARETLEDFGFHKVEEAVPWRDAFPDLTDDQLPGVVLRGARNREGLTQVELSRITGIPQRHISEMENGQRNIGKDRAQKLAQVFHMDYRIFL